MKLSTDARLRRAIYLGFVAGAAYAGMIPSVVMAQDAGSTTQLQGVEVTGSRVRSVDQQTSNPVFVMDRKAIAATGSTTLGELLQSIPAAQGVITNPQVNNGGGNGGASVNLRGLGAERTLVLLDGKRVINTTFSDISYVDLDTIPINMVERIEVLKQGASAVYGSDAIGGVVNIITRKNYKGGEVEATWGETTRSDGAHQNANVTYGTGNSSGNVVFGLNYDRQDPINASARSVTATPTAYYYGQLSPNAGTSGRSPQGRFTVPGYTPPANPACPDQGAASFRYGGVTLIPGHTGASPSDFTGFCNNSSGGYTDRYNFLPDNLLLTPSKRYEMFGEGQHTITSDIKMYGSAFFTHTDSYAQLAAEPIDNGTVQAIIGAVPISAQSIYNPFGVEIDSYAKRANQAGLRYEDVSTNTYQGTFGLKGTLLDRFDWDTSYTYGRIDSTETDHGFLNFSNLQNELGPSFWADPTTGAQVAAGTAGAIATCGTPGHVIAQCTPVDVVGTRNGGLAAVGTVANTATSQDLEQFLATIDGDLFQLPAGALGAAAGVEYRAYHYANTPDALEQAFTLSEANSAATRGAYDVREIFAEFRVPLLKDMPFVKSLVFTPGVRYSDYSSFGSTTNAKYGLEYRPYGDLLIRATYADIFRAPTPSDLYKGSLQDSPGFTDPCNKLGSANNPVTPDALLACQNVPTNGTFQQSNLQASAVRISNPSLRPETGFTTDFGLVYNPSFYKPLTVEVDVYKYVVDNAIGLLTSQNSVNSCFSQGQNCQYVGRGNDGNLTASIEPTLNLGFQSTEGIDFGFKLSYPKTPYGDFVISLDNTYLESEKFATISNGIELDYQSLAGHTDGGGNGTFPRLKSTLALYWTQGPWGATLYNRFIGGVREGSIYFNGKPDSTIDPNDQGACGTTDGATVLAPGPNPVTGAPQYLQCRDNVRAVDYVDITGSYTYKPASTTLTVGITDLFDQGAPHVYAASAGGIGTGYPTDPSIYDITGRAFFAKLKVAFK